jgi:hypothetical protein
MKLQADVLTVTLITALSCASPQPAQRGDLVRVRLGPAFSESQIEGRLIAVHLDSLVVRPVESDLAWTLARADVEQIHVARPGCAMTALGGALPFLVDPEGVAGWSLWAMGEAQFAWGCIRPSDMWRLALLPSLPSDPSSR